MREILFRGKCIDETCLKGQWLAGQILHDGVTGKYYIHMDNCLNESDNVGEEGLLRFVAYEVDPETICQYIDLIDKNGRKIFEGDIINDIDYGIMKCIYLHGSFVWYKEDDFKIECMKYVPVIEVIGNIFDNSELLKGDTNGKTDSM